MEQWYLDNIEPGVRNLVYYLRNNGINTECSCEHEKYIQCRYFSDGSIKELDNLLFNFGLRDYELELHLIRENGHLRAWVDIKLG